MDYAATRTNVGKTLGNAGQAMTLQRVTDPAFDPVSGGSLSMPDSASWTLNGVVTNYSSMDRLTSQNRDGSLIQSGDQKVLLEASAAVVPKQGDNLIIAGETWQIIAVDAVSPAGIAVLYKCQVRK